MQKITPFLWFNDNAQEAADFYRSIFNEDFKMDEASDGEKPMVVSFELRGQKFLALNGGPLYHFTEAISFMVDCKDQAEVDYFWDRLIEGGVPTQCGWLKDKFGLSWQIVPAIFGELMSKGDGRRVGQMMQAFMGMVKLDVKGLQEAYDRD